LQWHESEGNSYVVTGCKQVWHIAKGFLFKKCAFLTGSTHAWCALLRQFTGKQFEILKLPLALKFCILNCFIFDANRLESPFLFFPQTDIPNL
jgi:hypothetical protein